MEATVRPTEIWRRPLPASSMAWLQREALLRRQRRLRAELADLERHEFDATTERSARMRAALALGWRRKRDARLAELREIAVALTDASTPAGHWTLCAVGLAAFASWAVALWSWQ